MKYQLLQGTSKIVQAEFSARPSHVSAQVLDYAGTQLVASGTASVDLGWSTTITGTYGRSQDDPRKVGISDTSQLVWLETYRLQNSGAQREVVQAKGLLAGGEVELADKLDFDYASGDTFTTTLVKYTIPATSTSTLGYNYRVRLFASMSDGTTEVKDILFDVVHHVIPTNGPLTEERLKRRYHPNLDNFLHSAQKGEGWGEMLAGVRESVYEDLIQSGLQPDLLIDDSQLEELQLLKFRLHAAESGFDLTGKDDALEAARYYFQRYKASLERLQKSATWIDTSQDLSPNTGETNRPRRRNLIL